MKYTYNQINKWVLRTGEASGLKFVVKEYTEGNPVVEAKGAGIDVTYMPLNGKLQGRGSRTQKDALITACIAFLGFLEAEDVERERKREEALQALYKPSKLEQAYFNNLDKYMNDNPVGIDVFSGTRVATITGHGMNVGTPFVYVVDRSGKEDVLYTFQKIEYEKCKVCGGNGKASSGYDCPRCHGAGEMELCPRSLQDKLRIKCIDGYDEGRTRVNKDMKGYAAFDGFDPGTGEPLYRVKFDGLCDPVKVACETIDARYEIIRYAK